MRNSHDHHVHFIAAVTLDTFQDRKSPSVYTRTIRIRMVTPKIRESVEDHEYKQIRAAIL